MIFITGYDIIYNKHMDLRNSSGVYFIFIETEMIYIGQTNNLYRRLSEHMSMDTYNIWKARRESSIGTCHYDSCNNTFNLYQTIRNNIGKVTFVVEPMKSSALNNFEEKYIKFWKPKYNYAGVKCEYIPYNRGCCD